MATEQGIVIRAGADTAWVKTTQSSACEGCASKGSCHAQGDEREVEALNPAGARVGDRIVLTIDTSPFLKATFLLYVFPIICMIAGAAMGLRMAPDMGLDPSVGSAVAGFLFFFASIFFVKYKGNQLAERDDYKPRITRIIRSAGPAAPSTE